MPKVKKEDVAAALITSTAKAAGTAAYLTGKAVGKTKDLAVKTTDAVKTQLDTNGDGTVGIEDLIVAALKVPGVHVSRSEFLRKELFKNYPESVIADAIAHNPAHAGITVDEINKIADSVIKYERNCVSGISAALGTPGGIAMVATIPADIIQYYGYTLRATQKLLYLYGFPDMDASNAEGLQLDTETLNQIIICLGVMYGVAGANNAIKGMAKALAVGVEKQLMKAALTKGAFYPFVKSVMKWFGVRLTKEMFAGFFKKAIPVVGGVIGGGITFLSFKPCCNRLKNALQDTALSNPNHKSSAEEDKIFESIKNAEIIDVDVVDVPEAQAFTLDELEIDNDQIMTE